MPRIPIHNKEDLRLLRDECEAYDEDRWRDMVLSIRDRTMTKGVHKQLRHSLRKLFWSLPVYSRG